MRITRTARIILEQFGVTLTVVALTIVAMRVRSGPIAQLAQFNPDESDLLAAGRRGALSLVPFKDFTSSTYGPMWPFTLGWLHRLGIPLTLPVGRVIAAVIIIGCCTALLRTVRHRWGLPVAILVVVPLALHWITGFYDIDFLILTTEMLGLGFFVAACAIVFVPTPISLARATTAAALFGCAIFSKYSFVPVVAVALVALAIKMISSGHGVRRASLVALLTPFAPFSILVIWALAFGVPVGNIVESVHVALSYLNGGGLVQASPTLSQRLGNAWEAASHFPTLLPLIALLLASVVAAAWNNKRRPRRVSALHLVALGGIIAGFVSLMPLAPVFPHYCNLFLAGVILAVHLVASAPADLLESRRIIYVPVLALLVLFTASVSPVIAHNFQSPHVQGSTGTSWTSWVHTLTTKAAMLERTTSPTHARLSDLCPAKSKVIVWGWAADFYSQYDWVPATRYVITTPQMTAPFAISDPPRYRPRLLRDFLTNNPDCVVDAAVSAIIPWFGPPQALGEQWPEFVMLLDSKYSRHTVLLNGSVPISVWVRNN